MSFNPATDTGKVRLLINDVDTADHFFEDAAIAAFLELEGADVRRAAAAALETIASNEALVHKKIRLLDSSTDGPAVAKELRERARSLRVQAADGADGGGDFEIVEVATGAFGERERLRNEILRGA